MPSPGANLLRRDAGRRDHAAAARNIAGDLLPHLLGRGRRRDIAGYGEPLLDVGQRQRGADLPVDTLDNRPRRRGRLARPSQDMNAIPGNVSAMRSALGISG